MSLRSTCSGEIVALPNATSELGLGRVKMLESEEHVEYASSLPPMSSQAIARQLAPVEHKSPPWAPFQSVYTPRFKGRP
jgi:hypothetical protein